MEHCVLVVYPEQGLALALYLASMFIARRRADQVSRRLVLARAILSSRRRREPNVRTG
jgi:hypothetical protein